MYQDIEKPLFPQTYITADSYHDYRYLQDECKVLKNPHKGWYWHFIDNGYGRSEYRENIGDDHMLDFPGLNHLYLRFDWADIEKEEGVYDWSYIDEIFEKWGKLGYHFSFRVCTYEGKGIPFAAPKWLKDAGVKGYDCECGSWQPDYGDPLFLEKLENFFKEYGRKFNGHPLVEYIDIGSYGTWGEGHLGFGAGNYPIDVLIKHVNLHLKYFPDTFILINDDMVNGLAASHPSDGQRFMEYCAGKGLGFRDDSIMVRSYALSGKFGYHTLRSPHLFDRFYPQAPIDIESEHYHFITDDIMKDGYPLIESLRRTHATYCGFHGYPRPWLEKHLYLTEYLANRLGYWYFINGAALTEFVSDLPAVITLDMENKGFGLCYHSYTLKVALVNEAGSHIVASEDGLNLCLGAESVASMNIKLDLRGVQPGTYGLRFGMFHGNIPIQMGFRDACDCGDGFYELDTVTVARS